MLHPSRKLGVTGYNILYIEYTIFLNSHSQSAIIKMQQRKTIIKIIN